MKPSNARPSNTYRAARRNFARTAAQNSMQKLRDIWPAYRLRGDLKISK